MGFVVGLGCGSLFAADVWERVPAGVAGVITFRNLQKSHDSITPFVRKIDPEFDGLEPESFESMIGLRPGTIDPTQPVHVVLFRAEDLEGFLGEGGLGEREEHFPVVAFVPRRAERFAAAERGSRNRIRDVEGAFGHYFLLMKDGVAFVSNRKKPLTHIARVRPEKSLAASLDDDVESIYENSDFFIHLPLDRWRDKVGRLVWLAGRLIELSHAGKADPDELASGKLVAGWLVRGMKDVIDQMETVTLALSFDRTTIRLHHHHTFRPGGSVAGYLEQVERTEVDLWSSIPDQPFFMLGVLNWRCPAETSFLGRFSSFLFKSELPANKLPKRKRTKLIDASLKSFGAMRGMFLMRTSPPGAVQPQQIIGGYAVPNAARKTLMAHRFVQENIADSLSLMMPGGGHYTGAFTECGDHGADCIEMKMNVAALSAERRREVLRSYGKGACLQEAVLGDDLMIYSVAQPRWGVHDVAKRIEAGKHMGGNPHIRRIRSRLPQDANAVVIADFGRFVGLAPYYKKSAPIAESGVDVEPPGARHEQVGFGPLAGWACEVRADSIHGQFAVDAADVLKAFEIAGSCGQEAEAPRADK